MMTEVPVIFPSHVAKPQRFIVNDVEKTVRRRPVDYVDNVPSSLPLLEDGAANALHIGSASVSPLIFPSSVQQAMLTTSVLVENPRVLTVALSNTGDNLDSPVIVELDLESETQKYSNTVKIRAFTDIRKDREVIRLVLVDDNAVVLTLLLVPHTLQPLDVLEVLDIRDLLDDQPEMKAAVSGSLLHKTMVDFYAPHLMVVALSPLLMSVNLETDSCEVWLETQCLEDMRARRSAIGNIFSKASDLFLGKLEHAGGLVDMAPTAALCVSSTGNPLLDPTYVFTLHSDGNIKRWTVNDISLLPTEVAFITLTDVPMPAPREWSDDYNSVYLSARLYSQVYVLAVHIKTGSTANYDDDQTERVSDSHLYVFYGGQDAGVQSTVISSHNLTVPGEADDLVDMGFIPSLNSCSLMAMFRATTHDARHAGTTLTVRYPPSVVSIISTQPEVLPVDYVLDGVASSERSRIDALVFRDDHERTGTSTELSLQDELHDLDGRFMKFLFRPAYPRGSGTVAPPQEVHIRRALQKLVYGRTKRNDGSPSSISIELETLRAIYEWRSKENRRRMSLSPMKTQRYADREALSPIEAAPPISRTSATSVYDTFVAVTFDEYVNDIVDSDEDDETYNTTADRCELERTLQLEMHARLWRRLLVAIWEEEQSLRYPLCFCLVDSNGEKDGGRAVLVRSGFTSILADKAFEKQSAGVLAEFDEAAIKLMKAIEADDNNFKKLFSTEQRIWNHMAKAHLDEMTPSDYAEGYSKVVDFAFDSSAGGGAFSVEEQQHLAKALGKVSLEDASRFLQETPQSSLPGLNLFSGIKAVDLVERGASSNLMIANSQMRQAVCALSVRCIDASRRLLLARYLLLSYLVRSSRVSSTAFYLYLRSMAVLWTASQEVPMPTAVKATVTPLDQERDERPSKRPSIGDGAVGILPNISTTTCMDSLLISILQTRDDSTDAPLLSYILSLSQEVFCSSLRTTVPSASDISSGKLWKLLPELGALPPPSKPGVATDHPRLALRLLAPLVALSSANEVPNVRTARKEALAECLLVESRNQLSDMAMSAMRVKACELLASKNAESMDRKKAKAALTTLQNVAPTLSSEISLSEQNLRALAEELQKSIYGKEPEIRSEILRLTELETVKNICAPLFQRPNTSSEVRDAVKVLSPGLLQLSDLMHRVDILEYHVARNGTSSDLVLDFINGAIRQLQELFPDDFCKEMPEYTSLYNRLFHNAVSAGEWNQAFDACLNNPSSGRRVSSFKRLVNSMVDGGALKELLDKCSTLATSVTECVDLYGLATDALKDSCSRDLYLVRANAADASGAAPDYQGSLYSLHVSRGEWRKAAQSLDMRFVRAMHSLASEPVGVTQDTNVAVVREELIVEDLVLASVAASNAISLVHDFGATFIVCGEELINDSGIFTEASESSPKRRRQPTSSTGNEQGATQSFDRISRFMNPDDLKSRALWSLAFRTLCFDNSVDSQVAKSLLVKANAPLVDREGLDCLFERGYYFSALSLAMVKSKTNAGTSRSFYGSLLDLLRGYLIPLALEGKLSGGEHMSQRPSPSQLRRALDNIDYAPGRSPFIMNRRSKRLSELMESSLQTSASALVQKLTRLHSNAEHPAALEVAKFYLDYDGRAFQIPLWLSNLLMGDDVSDPSVSGLFARRPEPGSRVYLGDPSALLTLYMKRGMFLEACHVVSSILNGRDGMATRKEKAPSRLPEKGDIDFVPYKKIDILWNLIEKYLSKEELGSEMRQLLNDAQKELTSALEQHFAMMKVSEMGVRSARTLGQQSFMKPAY